MNGKYNQKILNKYKVLQENCEEMEYKEVLHEINCKIWLNELLESIARTLTITAKVLQKINFKILSNELQVLQNNIQKY